MSNNIGLLHIAESGMRTDENGNVYVIMKVKPESRYNIKPILQDIKRSEKDVTVTFSYKKNHRTLDQNALLWALLTIYADALGGDQTPEEIYYKMLDRYGVAKFFVMEESAAKELKSLFRDTKVIDDAVVVRSGKRTPAKLVKCMLGSSNYDTTEMTKLIDGVFDELAALGVDARTSREVSEYYEQWGNYKGGL